MQRRAFLPAAIALAGAAGAVVSVNSAHAQTPAPCKGPDVVYEPTPLGVVARMLEVAQVKAGDVVYDLGCGDARIVIAAALRGARGVGFEIEPNLVQFAIANVKAENLADKVKVVQQDLFTADMSEASVIALYLLPEMNTRLRPKFWKELKVGSRVVANSFPISGWEPDRVFDVPTRYRHMYLYTVKVEHKRA